MHIHINSTEANSDIDHLIRLLASDKKKERKAAREKLAKIGKPAIPALIKLLSNPSPDQRWEAACVLGDIADPEAAPALCVALEDDVVEVRWRAAEALIQMRRQCLVPLFQQLKVRFDCVQLREGAHHILHCLNDDGLLAAPALKVLEALESTDPDVTVPWAVEKALEALTSVQPSSPDVGRATDAKDLILRLYEDNPFLDEE